MPKFDLHVTSVPDHKSQLMVARLIVESNHAISMQTALEMAAEPPLLLYHRVEYKLAEQCVTQLKSLGIGFKISEAADNWDLESPPDAGGTVAGPLKGAQTPGAPGDALEEFAEIKAHNAANSETGQQPPPQSARPIEPTRVTPEHAPARRAGRKRTSELHISDIDESKIEAMEKKRSIMIASVVSGIIIIFGAVILIMERGGASPDKPSGTAVTTKSAAKQSGGGKSANKKAPKDAAAERAHPAEDSRRGAVGGEQRQQADSYVDSAKASGNDFDKQVAFYKVAISFNRYNLPAWEGLLQAYLDLGRIKEARETEQQMIEIFGDGVTSVGSVVNKSYGQLTDTYVSDGGVYRVEYKSKKRKKNDIMRDVFEMSRSVRNACGCRNISIYASTGAGKGLIANIPEDATVHNFSEFVKQAEIVWMD
nr:hypothetical protein [uncultured bacterium]